MVKLARDSRNERALERWWSQKYKLPLNDSRLLSLTREELRLEFFEDLWDNEKAVAKLHALVGVDPDVVLETGDEDFDEVERRIAAGEDPDEVLKDWGEEPEQTESDGFSDDYKDDEEHFRELEEDEPVSWKG